MRQTGCLPAAFVVAVLAAMIAFGMLQHEIYTRGMNVNLKLIVMIAAPVLVAIGAVTFVWLRRVRASRR